MTRVGSGQLGRSPHAPARSCGTGVSGGLERGSRGHAHPVPTVGSGATSRHCRKQTYSRELVPGAQDHNLWNNLRDRAALATRSGPRVNRAFYRAGGETRTRDIQLGRLTTRRLRGPKREQQAQIEPPRSPDVSCAVPQFPGPVCSRCAPVSTIVRSPVLVRSGSGENLRTSDTASVRRSPAQA
jgi:hypothetical protein